MDDSTDNDLQSARKDFELYEDEMFETSFETKKDDAKRESPKKENSKMENSKQKHEKQNSKKKSSGMIFLIVIVAMAVVALAYGFFNKNKKPSQIERYLSVPGPSKKSKGMNFDFSFSKNEQYIARLYIRGVIQKENQSYNQGWLLSTIDELKNDAQNLGILLVIDSPGGTVYEADEAYLALEEYKKSGKMVWAYFESLAASGGYYIGCAADTIFANRNTLTGSIGVIAGTSLDVTEFLANHGIKSTTFTAGKNKNMLNYNSPLTEEHKKIMQSVADDCYEQFTQIVASARQMSIEKIKVLADGRIYTARQAKQNGLIDSIGPLEDAQNAMLEELANVKLVEQEEKDEINFYDYEYEYQPPFLNRFLGMLSGAKNPTSFVDPVTKAAIETLAPNIEYPAYLYKN